VDTVDAPNADRTQTPWLHILASRCAGILFRPRKTIEAIESSPDWEQGLAITSIFGAAYSLAALTAYLAGHRPIAATPRFIPRDRFYLWESTYVAPLTVAWMGLFTTLTRFCAKRLGGTGTAQSDFTVLAFAQSIPMTAGFATPDLLSGSMTPHIAWL
jgi:hypothetical protein